MRRVVWTVIGVAIGVIAARKVTEVQSNFGPAGLNLGLGRLSDGAMDFADAVRAGMRERETDLRSALGAGAIELSGH